MTECLLLRIRDKPRPVLQAHRLWFQKPLLCRGSYFPVRCLPGRLRFPEAGCYGRAGRRLSGAFLTGALLLQPAITISSRIRRTPDVQEVNLHFILRSPPTGSAGRPWRHALYQMTTRSNAPASPPHPGLQPGLKECGVHEAVE